MKCRGAGWVFRAALVGVVGLAVGACGSAGEHPPATGEPGGGGTGGSGGSGEQRIQVDATDGTLPLSFQAAVTGAGSGRVGAISIAADAGTVSFDGAPVDVVLYEHQPWPDKSLDLLQGLVVEKDRWLVMWFYCQGTALVGVYYEGTNGPALTFEAATGTCAIGEDGGTVHATLPAVDMQAPTLAGGFAVTGADVTIPAHAPGSVTLGGETLAVYSFSTVDCSACDSTGGWYELHTILWDEGARRACFAIFYLVQDASRVEIAYSISLPDLGDPASALFLDGTWTKSP